MIELVGYIGMFLVILSFLFKDIKLIRIVNASGAVLSCIYGYCTKTYPTAILNLILLVINTTMFILLIRKGKAKNEN